jgi:hypothetical protein
MNIKDVNNAQKVADFILSSTHEKKLKLVFSSTITKETLRNENGRVYFLTNNEEIKKIGGSQCKGGIQSTLASYLGGMYKNNSPRTYCVWNYIRQEIKKGNKIEAWVIIAPSVTALIPTMSGFIEKSVPIDFHEIETACVKEYLEKEKKFPFLNMQESQGRWIDTGLLEGYPGMGNTTK